MLVVSHPESVKYASATMNRPQIGYLYFFMPPINANSRLEHKYQALCAVLVRIRRAALRVPPKGESPCYGRGCGVRRGLGVGVHLPVHGVGVGVGLGVGPDNT